MMRIPSPSFSHKSRTLMTACMVASFIAGVHVPASAQQTAMLVPSHQNPSPPSSHRPLTLIDCQQNADNNVCGQDYAGCKAGCDGPLLLGVCSAAPANGAPPRDPNLSCDQNYQNCLRECGGT